MKYTAAHWGSYQFEPGDTDLSPLDADPAPSRIGRGWASASQNTQARVMAPVVRQGWLNGDQGRNRCNDSFVEVSWDKALDLAAAEVNRIRSTHGNQAIFGGSYGWSSAGRFHHAQSQMRRMLALSGGFTSSRETYSHAAAEVLFPHILGMSNRAFQDQMTTLPEITAHCDILLSFGGISGRTAQIGSSGTTRHEIPPWIKQLAASRVHVQSFSPEKNEALGTWWPVRPGTDTALILALIYEITATGAEDTAFLTRYTSGWDTLRAYIMGQSDGTAKSADWAASICDIPADQIRNLALSLIGKRVMVSMAWGMQRADHGEQPIWAGLALAAVLGQIGKPGGGYSFGYGSTTAVGRPSRPLPWPSFPKVKNPIADFIPVARIADALLHPGAPYAYNGTTRKYPDLRMIWWTGGNPYHHHQDLRRLERAWCAPETVIVNEHNWTATARRADIVLPATTSLERDDIMMNRRDPTLLYMSALHKPVGQARDDFAIFSGIAERLGFGKAFTEGRDVQGWLRHLWSQCEQVARDNALHLPDFDAFKSTGRIDLSGLEQQANAFTDFIADPVAHPVASESGLLTLTNTTIAQMDLIDCPGHPTWLPAIEGAPLAPDTFHLISGQPETRLHSQNDQGSESLAAKVQGREVCAVHPDTAAHLGVASGDIVRLFNTRGACLCAVRIEPNMRADCISLPTGAWYDPQLVNGEILEVHGNPNILTRDQGCSALTQGNIAHTCVVRAERWTDPLPPVTVTGPPRIAPLS